jgi:hypothetical protein
MKRVSWLLMAVFVLPLLLAGVVEAAQGKKQNFGASTRNCKPPLSSQEYFLCGFGGGGGRR